MKTMETIKYKEGITKPKKNYYVTCMDYGKVGIVAGPWPTYHDAEKHVNIVRDIAVENNAKAWFYSWGISGSNEDLITVFFRNGINEDDYKYDSSGKLEKFDRETKSGHRYRFEN